MIAACQASGPPPPESIWLEASHLADAEETDRTSSGTPSWQAKFRFRPAVERNYSAAPRNIPKSDKLP